MRQEVFMPKEDSPIEKVLLEDWQKIIKEASVILDSGRSEEDRFAHVVLLSKKIVLEKEKFEAKQPLMSPEQVQRLEGQYQKMISFVLESFSKAPKHDVGKSFFG